ncbi:PTS lactose/cellobiose transporter subunit IIA [Lacrimispora indolis]|uniref:PTS lactose/cellobiose transporter subunit IIA n=1 Tax=Lacrimispora indolis TaxID=69825 RepID=UPI000400CA8D|nr:MULTISPECIES: PTS lactose/cellobiose transporter subunit IIA [Lachnospiraceae]MBE7722468.1 PTS lactose/cellobiose transporter subunit IIA [Lacrimispora celerecrescens]
MTAEDRHEILNETDNDQREQTAAVAMQIVIRAGDARNLIMEALDCIGESQFSAAQERLKEAQAEIRQAHIAQTEVIQAEAGGKEFAYSMLFTHAQDTVMTINTELNLAKKLCSMFEKMDMRISKLEHGGGLAV